MDGITQYIALAVGMASTSNNSWFSTDNAYKKKTKKVLKRRAKKKLSKKLKKNIHR